jgi:hypothetical protein
MLEHYAAIAAAKGLGAAGASNYCKSCVPEDTSPTYLLQLQSYRRDRVRLDDLTIGDQATSVRASVQHAVKHRAYKRHNVLAILA